MQINSANFGWLGLTMMDALDPCRSIAAGAEVLTAYSRYNTGSPTRGIKNGYAASVQAVSIGRMARPVEVPAVQADEALDLEDMPGQPETLQIGD